MKKNTILVVEDHPVVRLGLGRLLEPEFTICGEAEDAAAALRAIPRVKPDLVILDISLRGQDGIELLKEIRVNHADVRALVLSIHDESVYAERALRAGARGYVMKKEAPGELLTAVRRILKGDVYLSPGLTTEFLTRYANDRPGSEPSPVVCLSDRELEVFRRIGEGQGTRKIAEELGLSVKTVEAYRARIKQKMALNGARELFRCAIQWVSGQKAE